MKQTEFFKIGNEFYATKVTGGWTLSIGRETLKTARNQPRVFSQLETVYTVCKANNAETLTVDL